MGDDKTKSESDIRTLLQKQQREYTDSLAHPDEHTVYVSGYIQAILDILEI